MDAITGSREAAYEDFYRRLRRRLETWFETGGGRRFRFAGKLLLVPDLFHLVVKLLLDRRTPAAVRSQLLATAVYVVSPADLLPELLLGPVGFADDLVLLALMVERLLTSVPRELLLEHWAGDEDLLEVVTDVLANARSLVGGKLLERLKRRFGG